jgi:lactoylglutathione lyase
MRETPMAKAIHMMIRVLEEDRSVDFYRRAFGLGVAERLAFDSFTLVYLRNDEADFEVELTINHGRTEPYTLGDGYGHGSFSWPIPTATRSRFCRSTVAIARAFRRKAARANNENGRCDHASGGR